METWSWILGWFLSILTIFGNGFIIFLVCSKRQLRTKTNAFVVSLAVADFCVGLTVVPSLFFYEMIGCNYSKGLFKGLKVVKWFFQDVSVVNMCSLVLERYIAVVKPLQYLTFMTRRHVIQTISFSWGITIIFVSLESFLWLSLKSSLTLDILIWMITIFIFFLPCLLVFFCFISMLHIVSKHVRDARTLAKQLRFNHCVLLKTQENSAIIMMAIVIGVFLAYCGINIRCFFVNVLNDQKSCDDSTYKKIILVLNSTVNPLAYAFFKRDIKKEIKRLICTATLTKGHK